jgi:hypothetical protein
MRRPEGGERGERRHQRVWELLPWYVNGTLEDREKGLVEEHLAGCALCREEAVRCRAIEAELRGGVETAPSPHPVQLSRLMARIDANREAAERGWPRLRSLFAATPGAVRGLIAAQLAVLVLLAGVSAWRWHDRGTGGPAPLYQTLSDSAPATDRAPARRLRVVFAEDATERQIRDLLLGIGGQLAGGPSPLGAYTVEIRTAGKAQDPLEILLAHLRSQPLVRFAEPVTGERP